MSIEDDVLGLANKKRATFLARYFKTGKGEYGEGDVFIGLTVPEQRLIAKKYASLLLPDIEKLLHNKIHEYRLTSLMILSIKFAKSSVSDRKKIFDFYLQNTKYINNWDLIDGSSRDIIGMYLLDKPNERKILYALAKSKSLWERRIAVIATFAFIKQRDFQNSFSIAELLLNDPHDLIHKSVGWMLREIGKLDQTAEEVFLKKHYTTMPRTMLRYAIERFSPATRALYLSR